MPSEPVAWGMSVSSLAPPHHRPQVAPADDMVVLRGPGPSVLLGDKALGDGVGVGAEGEGVRVVPQEFVESGEVLVVPRPG